VSFTSLWSHFLANVAELASEGTMVVTSRIWRWVTAVGSGGIPRFPFEDFYRTPPLPRTFRARMISDFRGASGERGRAALVLPQRAGMEHACGTTQADAVSALQSGWHADSPWLSARLRREGLPTQDHPRSAGLLQQPRSAAWLRSDLQRLERRQDPAAEPDRPGCVEIPATRRRRQHRRGKPRRRRLPAK